MFRVAIDANPMMEVRGGVGFYTQNMADKLIEAKCHLTLVAMRKSENLSRYESMDNVEVVTGGAWIRSEALWSQFVLPFLLYKSKAKHFIGVGQSVPLVCFRVLSRTLIIHDFAYIICPETMSFGRRNYLKLFSKAMIKSSKHIFCISKGTSNKLLDYYNRKADNILMPPLRYSSSSTEYITSSTDLPKLPYYLCVGSFEPRKNIDKVVIAFAKANPEGEALLIVGGAGWNNSGIKDALAKAKEKLGDRLIVKNFVTNEDLCSYYKSAKATMLVSSYEGYGMPIAESRNLGTPIVATNTEEHKEAAEGNGLFLSLNDLESELVDFFISKGSHISSVNNCSYLDETTKMRRMLDVLNGSY